MSKIKEYRAPTLTIDGVFFRIINKKLNVLLIERQREPFKGAIALPGGYSPFGQTTLKTLQDIAKRKAGIEIETDLNFVEQLYAFDAVSRDPRGHAVSLVYFGCGYDFTPSTPNEKASFHEVDDLPALAYDHKDIINFARKRLASQLDYEKTVFGLLPKSFTLAQLQEAYEAILSRALEKRNFRKKIKRLNIVEETGEVYSDAAHRPARLYRLKN